MATAVKAPADQQELVPADEAIRQRFLEFARTLPQADGDGALRIVEQIMAAEQARDLDQPWSTTDAEALVGVVQIIQSAEVAESDFAEGLGAFLIVRSINARTGELFTWTTGSTSVVAQIVMAHVKGLLPLKCMLVESERPSKNGYRPQHLQTKGLQD